MSCHQFVRYRYIELRSRWTIACSALLGSAPPQLRLVPPRRLVSRGDPTQARFARRRRGRRVIRPTQHAVSLYYVHWRGRSASHWPAQINGRWPIRQLRLTIEAGNRGRDRAAALPGHRLQVTGVWHVNRQHEPQYTITRHDRPPQNTATLQASCTPASEYIRCGALFTE